MQESSSVEGAAEYLRWKSNFDEICFEIFRKEAILSQDFSVVGSSFQMKGAATEKACLPRFSFVLGIESCCEVDDLSNSLVVLPYST